MQVKNVSQGYINEEDVPVLDAWRKDPAHWDAGK